MMTIVNSHIRMLGYKGYLYVPWVDYPVLYEYSYLYGVCTVCVFAFPPIHHTNITQGKIAGTCWNIQLS